MSDTPIAQASLNSMKEQPKNSQKMSVNSVVVLHTSEHACFTHKPSEQTRQFLLFSDDSSEQITYFHVLRNRRHSTRTRYESSFLSFAFIWILSFEFSIVLSTSRLSSGALCHVRFDMHDINEVSVRQVLVLIVHRMYHVLRFRYIQQILP